MTNPTPHGQVPEALIDLIDAYAETRHRCGGIYNARTEAARNAVIEALSGVQALSAAPAGWKLAPLAPTRSMMAAAVIFANGNAVYKNVSATALEIEESIYGEAYSAMLAASPTPTAEQQAAPKAAPGEQNTVPAEWLEQAYREAWAACRDAETIGEEAEDWAFGNSAANSRMIDAQQSAPQQEAQPNYVVSLVVVKEIPTGVNTQNKLYTVNAASADEAVDKAVLQMPNDFPEHRLHTACFVAIPAQLAPQPAPACHHRPPCDECAALAAQGGSK